MVWRDSKGLPLIGPTRRHVHQTRNAEAAWKGSVDCRLDDVRSEEGEGKSHAGRSFTDAFAGGDRPMPSTLPEIISLSHRRPLAMADRSFLLASARDPIARQRPATFSPKRCPACM